MSEADMLRELFDIAWDIQINNKDKNEELVKKAIKYLPDIMQQFDYLENKEITPSKTLEELGYKKRENELNLSYLHKDSRSEIVFYKPIKTVAVIDEYGLYQSATMEELKAIYKQCEDLGWI